MEKNSNSQLFWHQGPPAHEAWGGVTSASGHSKHFTECEAATTHWSLCAPKATDQQAKEEVTLLAVVTVPNYQRKL